MRKFNGIEIGSLKRSNYFTQHLYLKKYKYSILNLKAKSSYETSNINIGSIVVISANNSSAKIKINNSSYKISKFKFFIFKSSNLKIETSSKITIGLAGIKKNIKKNILKKFSENEIYRVNKPWGYELWINGQEPTYSFKKIFIKKGNRTSLQFHKKKIETNYLFKGKAELTLSKKSGKYDKDQILNNIYKKKLKPGNFLNVDNYAVHRLKAISNITLYEVSTPHLDDVIRLADDKKRQHGRIKKEHLMAK